MQSLAVLSGEGCFFYSKLADIKKDLNITAAKLLYLPSEIIVDGKVVT